MLHLALAAGVFIFSINSHSKVIDLKRGIPLKNEKGALLFPVYPIQDSPQSGFMARLIIPAGGSVPEHRDLTDEFIYVVKGEGEIWINDQSFAIKPGFAVHMPANAKVKFAASQGSEVEVVQFFAPSGPETKYLKWKPKSQ